MSGDFRPSDFGSKLQAGNLTSCSERPEVTEARSDHLPCTSRAENPGRFLSTRNPRTFPPCSSLFAQTTATSAIEPEVIHIFSPLRTYSSALRTARVRIAPGFDAKAGPLFSQTPQI